MNGAQQNDETHSDPLLAEIAAEALREPFPLDLPVYEAAGRDPAAPILFSGSLTAPVAFLGRDLGRDEVLRGEPLIGAAGRQVRQGCERAGVAALLTNTVPYKPPGNKAYPLAVVRRFRPMIARLLVSRWQGDLLITLGNRAFEWFKPYHDGLKAFWADEQARYAARLSVTIDDGHRAREIQLAPLPHPSPLNARWYKQFPELLAARLAQLER